MGDQDLFKTVAVNDGQD